MNIPQNDIASKQNSPNAEFCVIAYCLTYETGFKKATEILVEIDFYDGKARSIWQILVEMDKQSLPIDLTGFLEFITKQHKLDAFGGRTTITSDIMCLNPTEKQFLFYVEAVKKLSLTRQRVATLRQEVSDLESGKKQIELPSNHFKVMTDTEICNLKLPEMNWIIPGIIPEGLTILAGKPKLGKSWLALSICLGITNGGYVLGKIPVKQYGALYLALEDTERRIQDRIKQLNIKPTGKLRISLNWRKGEAGAADMDEWLTNHLEDKLVIIDTLAKIRESTNSRRSIYDLDYECIGLLKRVADKHRAAVIVVHHVRKGESDDPLEMVSGTTGLSGAADTILILNRGRGQVDAELFITGRDVNEDTLALQKDSCAGWVLLGDAAEYKQSEEKRQIINLLRVTGEPMTPKEIALALGKTNLRMTLTRMEKEFLIKKIDCGRYTYLDNY